ncbi:lasso peptide biosynthesis PqqD family chaperone [Paenibacillus nanensis]|uniref:Lasso peptide biosynthesis PqqD family chaperone n=1 Tax=Paenibacillus nanensis TaxID=393251 RepID=A0A3A1UVS8_9BACL|nr:lasso peptide biosynthesis PqqD family chaperone [Paenibacillus nanensis]RIX52617.1 lasso peptide biosynthesis PqqD family chaperone [Paenibacillus nanensis]
MNSIDQLGLSDVISSSKENIVSDMGGEKVMLSVKNGNYYNLGHIGGQIWDLIAEPISVDELVQKLLLEFEVERAECEQHVFSFLEHLRKEGLLVIHAQNKGIA